MGFRFSIQSANTVANLCAGKVITCYNDIISSSNSYNEFLEFLHDFDRNYFSSDRYVPRRTIARITQVFTEQSSLIRRQREDDELSRTILEMSSENQWKLSDFDKNVAFKAQEVIQGEAQTQGQVQEFNRPLLEALTQLSNIFRRCKIKMMLLPGINKKNDFMLDERMLRKLISYDSANSCLVLQPDHAFEDISVFNVFSNFDVALRQASSWPAVFIWSGVRDYVFVPINCEQDLVNIIDIITSSQKPMAELKLYLQNIKKQKHYVFQLSDLHIGVSKLVDKEKRLKDILNKKIKTYNEFDKVKVIVTGDAVNSPNNEYENRYKKFEEYVKDLCGEKPIRVLGNHDINFKGLAFLHRNQDLINNLAKIPRIEVLDEHKIIFLVFNSNTGGTLAQGMIGKEQMQEMEEKLQALYSQNNKYREYKVIATLHHHITPIPEPNGFAKKLFGKQLERTLTLVDANQFIYWLKKNNVKVVMHGHKHIPFITSVNDIQVISCGSSTGQVKMKDKYKTCISFNELFVDGNSITFSLIVEDTLGVGAKSINCKVVNF